MENALSVWEPILQAARFAPSPHNVQPWRVRLISDTRADLYHDPARTINDEDTTGAFQLCAQLMFVEAARLTAAAGGQCLSYTLADTPDNLACGLRHLHGEPLAIARLHLSPLNGTTSADTADTARLLATRRTSRLSYESRPVAIEARQALSQCAAQFAQTFTLIDDPVTVETVLRENTRALFHDLNDPTYSREIKQWFRLTNAHADRTRDGLSAQCMNLPTPLFAVAAHLPQMAHVPGLSSVLSMVYRTRLGRVPALGLLSGPFFTPTDAVRAAPGLLHFWLEAARQNLSLHPLGNLVTNARAAAFVRERTGVAETFFVFKIGYSPPAPPAHRLPLSDLL